MQASVSLTFACLAAGLPPGQGTHQRGEWILDTGASHHMTWCEDLLEDLQRGNHGTVSLADGSRLLIKGIGKAVLTVVGSEGMRVLRLADVLWVPDLASNLISVMRALQGDVRMDLGRGGAWIGTEGDMSVFAPHLPERGGCVLTTEEVQGTARAAHAVAPDVAARLLHERLGHPSPKAAVIMWQKGAARGTNVSMKALTTASAACDACKQGKGVRAPFPHSARTVQQRLELVLVDVIGPLKEGTGSDGEKYVLTIVDGATRKVWAYPIAAKGNALPTFLDWATRAQRSTGLPILTVRSDNGKEFVNRQSRDWAKELGVWWETTVPYSSQQNGIAERWNRTLQDRMRTMLVSARLDDAFWPHAMRAAAYVLNRTPRLKDGGRIPEQDWTGEAVDVSNLRVFGCLCWPLVQSAQREGKLSQRRIPAIFLGYGEAVKGWKVYIPTKTTNRLNYSRDVLFDEHRRYADVPAPRTTGTLADVLGWHEDWSLVGGEDESGPAAQPVGACEGTHVNVQRGSDGGEGEIGQQEAEKAAPPPEPLAEEGEEDGQDAAVLLEDLLLRAQIDGLPNPAETQDAVEELVRTDQPESEETSEPPLTAVDRPNEAERAHVERIRGVRQPTRWSERLRKKGEKKAGLVKAFAKAAQGALLMGSRVSADGIPLEPHNLSEAKSRPDWEKWWESMKSEHDSLVAKKTWTKVPRKVARRLVRCRWVYKLKLDEYGRAARYKARLVAMGNTQRAGIDFKETFSPVARMASLRILLVLAVHFGWIVHQCDVVTAYLNGVLQEEVFMQQPPGFEDGTSDVLKLLRALYGLKQSGREWNEVLVKALVKAGFSQLVSEPCIFVRNASDPKRIVVLAVYVDDILIFTPSQDECDGVKDFLRREFEITDNGPIHHFLGVQVRRDLKKKQMMIGQTAYAKATLQRYGMENATGRDLPMHMPGKVASAGAPTEMGDYAARVGSLMWLAQCTRPDMSFPVGVLARKMASPDAESTANAQRALRYLRKTAELSMVYSPSSDVVLEGFSDSDFAGDKETRRSTTGYVFMLYGCAVSWRSQLQRTVAGSTTEAEYMALYEATREALWIRNFLTELGMAPTEPTPLRCDNEAACKIANNPAAFGKSKSFELHYHFTRERVKKGCITVSRVDSANNLADILTKLLPRDRMVGMRKRLGVTDG